MKKMTNPEKTNPQNPIATELAYLMLAGITVDIDGNEVVLSGAGTVLVPETHDLRKVVLDEAKYSRMAPEVINSLEEAMRFIVELPPAACYMRTKKWRVLLVVLDSTKEFQVTLRDYISVWSRVSTLPKWDIIVFKADPDGKRFEQVELDFES